MKSLYLSSTHLGFVRVFVCYEWEEHELYESGSSWPHSNPLRCFTDLILRRLP